MYDEKEEMISSDIWHGKSIEEVKFWVRLEIRKIIASSDYERIEVKIDEI